MRGYRCPADDCSKRFDRVDDLVGHVAGEANREEQDNCADRPHVEYRDSRRHARNWYLKNCGTRSRGMTATPYWGVA